jgi:hypothetical protein
MKTIGIVGTRRKDKEEDFQRVKEEFLKHYEVGDAICSGLCPSGADRFAVILSKIYNTPVKWFPAKWDLYGKAAGFKRNTNIAEISDIIIAMVSDDRTGGTEDTVKKFIKFHGEENLFIIK